MPSERLLSALSFIVPCSLFRLFYYCFSFYSLLVSAVIKMCCRTAALPHLFGNWSARFQRLLAGTSVQLNTVASVPFVVNYSYLLDLEVVTFL